MPPYGFVRRGPWYRGGVPRSYIPPTIFASVGFAICLVFFAIFLILAGGIMFALSGHVSGMSSDPRFNTEFFKQHSSPDPMSIFKTIGPIFLGIGFTLLLIAIILCVVVACLAKKQEDKRHKRMEQAQPLASDVPLQPPPPSAYPHQQAPENVYPPAGNYPSQQPYDQYPPGSYPQQYPQSQYQPQPPPGFYPPPSSCMPPPQGSPYPPPNYPQPTPNVAPESSQYMSAGPQPASESTKYAL